MTKKLGMTENPRWATALLVAAAPVLVAGSIAWVFPGETAAAAGPWALPTLSLISLLLALGLAAAESRLLMGLLAVLGITLVSGWNPVSGTSTSHLAGACLGFLVMLAIERAASTPSRLRLAMLAFLAAGVGVLVLGLAGTGVVASRLDSILPVHLPRLQLGLAGLEQGGDVNPNALSAAVLLVAPLGASIFLLRTGQKTDWLGLIPLAFAVVVTGVVTLAVCHSRSAWVVIWLVPVGVLVRGTKSWRSRIVLGAIVVAPLFLATGSVSFLSQKGFVTEAEAFWKSAHDRSRIMTQGIERWKESPWLGIGLNEFRSVYQPQGTDIAHVHNMALQTALDVGLAGSAAYWGVLAFLLVRANQAASGLSGLGRIAAVGSALSLVAVSLFGLADAVPLGSKIGVFQWMASGLILAAWRMRYTETP